MVRGQRRRGFTLIELLVVVVILGILAGLTLAAVNRSRVTALRARCINNQEELFKAIAVYDSRKGALPGALNPGPKSYAVVLLPEIGRNDLWADQGWRTSTGPTVKIALYMCPSDPSTANAPLSYVVNANWFIDRSNAATSLKYTITDVKGSSQVVAIAERTGTANWSSTTLTDLQFTLPATGQLSQATAQTNSLHGGGVNMTFFDGATKFMSDNTDLSTLILGR